MSYKEPLPITRRQQVAIDKWSGALVGTARVTMSRSHGEDVSLVLEVEDQKSGTLILHLEMTPEAFGNAVTGSGAQLASFIITPANIGKTPEHKEELVPFPQQGYGKDPVEKEAAETKALAPFEVDGWKGRRGDLGNHHRQVGAWRYKVSFTRYV